MAPSGGLVWCPAGTCREATQGRRLYSQSMTRDDVAGNKRPFVGYSVPEAKQAHSGGAIHSRKRNGWD